MECDICCNDYSEVRQPKILSSCGHTICSLCVIALRVNGPLGPTVVCPHCRKGTIPTEIRTNFVLADLVRSAVSGHSEKSNEISCKFHPRNRVCVLCVTCGVFVCTACFETNDTPHASHVRVTINDGVEIVQNEKERIREHLRRVAETIRCQIVLESASVEESNQKLRVMALNAVDHYTSTVSSLKEQLDMILSQLTNCQTLIAQDLQLLLAKQSHIHKLLNDVADSRDIISTELFLQTRTHIDSALVSLIEASSVSESLEDLSIGSRNAKKASPSKEVVLPDLVLKESSGVQLFELVYPTESRDRTNVTYQPLQTLHRSTSNDNLRI